MTFSKKFCAKSPFKVSPQSNYDRIKRSNSQFLRNTAEMKSEMKHEGRSKIYADQEKEMLLAAAERKEKNAAKKEAKGNTKAAARKRRKAAKLRERAENTTGGGTAKRKVRDDMREYDLTQPARDRRREYIHAQHMNSLKN